MLCFAVQEQLPELLEVYPYHPNLPPGPARPTQLHRYWSDRSEFWVTYSQNVVCDSHMIRLGFVWECF